MSGLVRDGTAELVSRDQVLRRERGLGDINFPCSADHEQDWQPYPLDPYSILKMMTIHRHRSHVEGGDDELLPAGSLAIATLASPRDAPVFLHAYASN